MIRWLKSANECLEILFPTFNSYILKFIKKYIFLKDPEICSQRFLGDYIKIQSEKERA